MSGVVATTDDLRTTLCSVPTRVIREGGVIVEIELCTQHVEARPCPFHPDGTGPAPEPWHRMPQADATKPVDDLLSQLRAFGFPTGPPQGGMSWE